MLYIQEAKGRIEHVKGIEDIEDPNWNSRDENSKMKNILDCIKSRLDITEEMFSICGGRWKHSKGVWVIFQR